MTVDKQLYMFDYVREQRERECEIRERVGNTGCAVGKEEDREDPSTQDGTRLLTTRAMERCRRKVNPRTL